MNNAKGENKSFDTDEKISDVHKIIISLLYEYSIFFKFLDYKVHIIGTHIQRTFNQTITIQLKLKMK